MTPVTMTRVRARIDMLPAAEGGRATPLVAFYRPNHNFGTNSEPDFRTGQVEIPPGQLLRPGESGEFEIMFLEYDEGPVRARLWPGRQWLIQEANRIVGSATTIEVLD